MSLTSIRFLADDTTYPNASDINFLFQLPDKSVLPVYYTSPTGRFFFGEERTPDSGKEIIYERPTDDKLPSITTEEFVKELDLTEEEIESYTGCSERTQRCLTDCPWPFPGAYINEAS